MSLPRSPQAKRLRREESGERGYEAQGASAHADAPLPLAVPEALLAQDVRVSFRAYAAYMTAHKLADRGWDAAGWDAAYEAYRAEHTRRQLWTFFCAHKEEAWFAERYAPGLEYIEARRTRRTRGCAGASEWIAALSAGRLDALCLDVACEPVDGASLYTVVDRTGTCHHFDSETVPLPPDSAHTLRIRSWPADKPRAELEAYLCTYAGYRYTALWEPTVQWRWNRAGLVVFEEGTDIAAACRALDGHAFGTFVLHLAHADEPSRSRLRITPPLTHLPPRVEFDVEEAERLVRVLQREKDDTTDPLAAIHARAAAHSLGVHDPDASVRHTAVRPRTDAA